MLKQKLELTWIGKDEELKLEPRILIEDPKKSYGDSKAENMLIHGDNLLALKALEQDFTGGIKCIYIDPPFNTGQAFEKYDDGVEHSIWLSLMKNRLEILQKLLAKDGTIWVELDETEHAYCKVMMDEIFQRNNYLGTIVYRRRMSQANLSSSISVIHNFILVYAKSKDAFSLNKLKLDIDGIGDFKNPDGDHRGPYATAPCSNKGGAVYEIVTPTGKRYSDEWRFKIDTYNVLLKDNRITFPKGGDGKPRYKIFKSERSGVIPSSWWDDKEFATQNAKQEMERIFLDRNAFDTPKPEALLKRIVEIASNYGDWVLDSFLGSGTTAAVAHKMGRKWIGIEFGDHANTHCLPRLKKVVQGKDGLALSDALGWKGGGGFKFYELAPSLLRKDKYGNWVIDEKYNANMLAAAMCKHEGFKFFPDAEIYWKQGKSTESDYIFVTTSFVTVEQLDKIHEEMKRGESLLICAKSFAPQCKERHRNITIKKIPQMVLGKCEFGKNNYDLNIINASEDDSSDGRG